MDKTDEIQKITEDLAKYAELKDKCKDRSLFYDGVIDRFLDLIFAQSDHIIELEKDVAELKEKLPKSD